MGVTIFIDGGAGTTGLEIRQRLEQRNDVTLLALDDADRRDAAKRKEALHAADIAILCLPDDAAREAVAMVADGTTRIIDASTAHRVHNDWAYGFSELSAAQAEAIASARFVSNPGCYPTGFLALVAPLVSAGLVPADYPFTVNAVSGYSGGGKALIARIEDDEPDIAYRGYGLDLSHKHLPEMKVHAGLAQDPIFAPAVIPAYRGMVVEVPLHIGGALGVAEPEALHEQLVAHYAETPLVSVAPLGESETPGELLLRSGVPGYDGLKLHVFARADGTQVRLMAVLDNLGKGAGGAAVQNLNIMAGIDPLSGLRV
ncbi:N-acetyl-gamma-glutamyl-phosphate reductase [Alterisphingorhabdus coralli]|uniref:N-acetyl-gamma-glutamyl-phosphate reductase n=1 Tax=Alterisphingorhabdus coralli TaxID=3071408 RepID=A0AA97F5S0_9SPHN|nr:N-acetyl-gamma-glutamyl-phosphate reductase [Parasphingorhabdus sp. SCSIO 66989]WOE74491.1 N-acetyl-gamma-glutamyl-phosphate reductase [Parasphingorhabdus sp. SCSIO 66989]